MQENQNSEQFDSVRPFFLDVVQIFEKLQTGTTEEKAESLMMELAQKGYALVTGEQAGQNKILDKTKEGFLKKNIDLLGQLNDQLQEQVSLQKGYIEKLEDKLGIPHMIEPIRLTVSN